MLLGDYCMSPNDNIINMFSSGSIHDLLDYYLRCSPDGNDILGGLFENATKFSDLIDDAISDVTSTSGLTLTDKCEYSLNNVSHAVASITPIFNYMGQLVQCPNINQIWYQIVNVGLCGDSFSGLFEIWLIIIITNVLLFFSMCIASVLFVQFDLIFEDPNTPVIEVIDEFGNGEYVVAPSAPSAPLAQFCATGLCDNPGSAQVVEMVAVDSKNNKNPEYNLYGVVV